MSLVDEINKAVGAHGMWKIRLREAIDTGKSTFTVANVKVDNLCEFGKWLYSLPSAQQTEAHWKTVQTMHAEFHKVASSILAAALSGQKEQAENGLKAGGDFARTSAKLTAAMVAWRDSK